MAVCEIMIPAVKANPNKLKSMPSRARGSPTIIFTAAVHQILMPELLRK